ncbi:MAG: hypothetical protein ABSE93_22125 [Terriglobia bacterium]|jgi:type II secretory pathway pseudopilin PulG
MESAPIGLLIDLPKTKGANRRDGFSLLDMMMVITVILIAGGAYVPTV